MTTPPPVTVPWDDANEAEPDTVRQDIEAMVRSTQRKLGFAAPEVHDDHWRQLAESLISYMTYREGE